MVHLTLTAEDGAVAFLGPAGIVSASAGKGYTCEWPIKVVGSQSWTMSGSDRIYFKRPLVPYTQGEICIRIEGGGGGVSFMASSPHLTHSLAISNGTVNVAANNALGLGTTYFDGTKVTLNLFGVTLDNPIVCTVNNASSGARNEYLKGLANKTNIFNGCYTMPYDGHAGLKGGSGTHTSSAAASRNHAVSSTCVTT